MDGCPVGIVDPQSVEDFGTFLSRISLFLVPSMGVLRVFLHISPEEGHVFRLLAVIQLDRVSPADEFSPQIDLNTQLLPFQDLNL